MSFSPAKVVSILLAEFGVPDDNDAPTREEKKIARTLAAILRDGAAASVDVKTDEDLGSELSTDNKSDWDHCDDEGEENSAAGHYVRMVAVVAANSAASAAKVTAIGRLQQPVIRGPRPTVQDLGTTFLSGNLVTVISSSLQLSENRPKDY